MKVFRKYNLIALFLAIGLFCSFQPVYAGTRAILSNGKIKLTDGEETATINPEGNLNITPHAHPDNGVFHFHVDGLAADTQFILIDISDIINYPHVNTDYVHIDWLDFEVDASANADYTVSIGFLEDVDINSGDFYVVSHFSGTKQTGQNKELFKRYIPAGVRARASSVVTHAANIDTTDWQTNVDLATTLDPTTADTGPGIRDFVMKVIINAQNINLAVDGGYHTH